MKKSNIHPKISNNEIIADKQDNKEFQFEDKYPSIRDGSLLKALEQLRDNDYGIFFYGLGRLNLKYNTTDTCRIANTLIDTYNDFCITGVRDNLLDEFVEICLADNPEEVSDKGQLRILIPMNNKEIVVEVDMENQKVIRWTLEAPEK